MTTFCPFQRTNKIPAGLCDQNQQGPENSVKNGSVFYNCVHQVPQAELPHVITTRVHLWIIEPGKEVKCDVEMAGQTLDFQRMFSSLAGRLPSDPEHILFEEKQCFFAVKQRNQSPRGRAGIL